MQIVRAQSVTARRTEAGHDVRVVIASADRPIDGPLPDGVDVTLIEYGADGLAPLARTHRHWLYGDFAVVLEPGSASVYGPESPFLRDFCGRVGLNPAATGESAEAARLAAFKIPALSADLPASAVLAALPG